MLLLLVTFDFLPNTGKKNTCSQYILGELGLNGSDLLRHIQALSDTDLKALFEDAARAIYAEEIETGLKFPIEYFQPDDIVLTVIQKMLSGDKGAGFDSKRGSIVNWIRGAVRFEVKNLIRLKSSQTELVIDNEEDNQDIEWVKATMPPLEAVHIKEEQASSLWGLLYELVGDDIELVELVKVLEDGFDLKKPQKLAEILNWDIVRVSNAKKRFMRIVLKSGEDFRSIL